MQVSFTRLGRRLFWPRPVLYRTFGILRGRGDCFQSDFDIWVDGYPRSANTFCAQGLQLANSGLRIRKHQHLPPFIIRATEVQKPGIFLLRRPIDAVISWAIFWDSALEPCLDYYTDFHRAMRPFISRLFLATFEQVTTNLDGVIERFNDRFGTGYNSPANDAATVSDCFVKIEQTWTATRHWSIERTVPRPSEDRARIKPAMLQRLQSRPALMKKLGQANELYFEFRSGVFPKNDDTCGSAIAAVPE